MSSPSNKAKKWQAFVSRLVSQANFICDGPVEVSFTNPEGSRVLVTDLSQLRQTFNQHGSDKNQLQLHLTSTDKDGIVHHTTISIRRPASRSSRRRKDKTTSSQSASEETSNESQEATMSASFVMRPPVASPEAGRSHIASYPAPQSMTTPTKLHSPSRVASEATSMSLSPAKSATSVESSDLPLEEEKQAPPPSGRLVSPNFRQGQQLSRSNPMSLEEQRHLYYRQHGRFVPSPNAEGFSYEREVPVRHMPPSHLPVDARLGGRPATSTSPFVSPPQQSGDRRAASEPLGLPSQESADLTTSIRNLTSQLQSLIQQQQQQMATQTATAVADISALEHEVQDSIAQEQQEDAQFQPGQQAAEPEMKREQPSQPNVSHELSDKLDTLSQHITQIGSVVEKFNESARLIHESVQNLMTTSLSIQQQQQQLSMSMSQMAFSAAPPSSFMMTGVQTPQGVMYYPVAMDQNLPQMTPTPGPSGVAPGGAPAPQMFRPTSLTSSYVSNGTPILQPRSSPAMGARLPTDHFAMGKSMTPTRQRRTSEFTPPAEPPAKSAPAQHRSVSVQDVLNSPRLAERTPPVRTLSARMVRPAAPQRASDSHSNSDPQAQQLVIVPPSQEGPKERPQVEASPGPGALRPAGSASTGSLPSDAENTASLRLSASVGSQDSGISEDLKEKLRTLKQMGYTNRTFNLVLLQQNNGDIDSVLADLKQFEQYK